MRVFLMLSRDSVLGVQNVMVHPHIGDKIYILKPFLQTTMPSHKFIKVAL